MVGAMVDLGECSAGERCTLAHPRPRTPKHRHHASPTARSPCADGYRLGGAARQHGAVLAALLSYANAALPGQDAATALKRTLLRCLLECGFKQRSDGGYELHAVLAAQLGEAVMAAVKADAVQRALYRTPGYTLAQLLDSLQSCGLMRINFNGVVKYAAARWDRLAQLGQCSCCQRQQLRQRQRGRCRCRDRSAELSPHHWEQ